jgi:hypothetical protein
LKEHHLIPAPSVQLMLEIFVYSLSASTCQGTLAEHVTITSDQTAQVTAPYEIKESLLH